MQRAVFRLHLAERGLEKDFPGIFIDDDSCRVTFLLYNLSGQIVGVQRYNPFNPNKNNGGRYNTYIAKSPCGQQKIAVFGLQFYRRDLPLLFLTEGIFDAIRIINSGQLAIALLSCDVSKATRSYLKLLPQKKVAILDADSAGKKLSRYGDLSFGIHAPFKDLGEMPQTTATLFIEKIVSNLMAGIPALGG